MANQLDYLLSLYIWNYQAQIPETYAPWINGATLNANPMLGGGGINTWFTVSYAPLARASVTASGLASGTSWTATIGYETETGAGSSLSFGLPLGTYTYSIGVVNGYSVNAASGTVRVTANNTTSITARFTSFGSTPTVPVTFSQAGILSGSAHWTAVVTGIGGWTTTSTSVTIDVPVGNYSFSVENVPGYRLTTPSGTVDASSSGAIVTIPFISVTVWTSAVVVTESGLSSGTNWSATIAGFAQASTTSFITFYQANGTYAYSVGAVSGYSASSSNGSVTTIPGVVGIVVPIVYTAIVPPGTLAITLAASGPSSATLYIDGVSQGSIAAGQTTSDTVAIGTYSILVTATGYYNYYNNATVIKDSTTSVPVAMNSNGTGSSSSAISTTAWALIGIFVVSTVIFLIATMYFMRGARPPETPPPSASSDADVTPSGNVPPRSR